MPASSAPITPLAHLEPKVWDDVIAVNVTANWRLIRSLDPLLRQSDAGRALFVTSGVTKSFRAYWGVYSASKAALEALVRTYAAEIGADERYAPTSSTPARCAPGCAPRPCPAKTR